jgi:hypothetical protein
VASPWSRAPEASCRPCTASARPAPARPLGDIGDITRARGSGRSNPIHLRDRDQEPAAAAIRAPQWAARGTLPPGMLILASVPEGKFRSVLDAMFKLGGVASPSAPRLGVSPGSSWSAARGGERAS